MSDAADERSDPADDGEAGPGDDEADTADGGADTGDGAADTAGAGSADSGDESVEALRREVEEKYDFENFGPSEMAEMSAEEWDAVFDPETWITGEELLDRVEADLERRVADRDVFARVERHDDRIVAYSDEGYATIYADGTVEGRGTVLRDVKPTVALCSMESYDAPEAPPGDLLPEPQEVPEGSGELGNNVLQVVAGIQVLAGVVLVGAWLLVTLGVVSPPGGSVRSLNVIGMLVAGIAFLAIGILLFVVVANARLSDKFRAEEYRNRLRAVDLEPGERPEFLPDDAPEDGSLPDADETDGSGRDESRADESDGGESGSGESGRSEDTSDAADASGPA